MIRKLFTKIGETINRIKQDRVRKERVREFIHGPKLKTFYENHYAIAEDFEKLLHTIDYLNFLYKDIPDYKKLKDYRSACADILMDMSKLAERFIENKESIQDEIDFILEGQYYGFDIVKKLLETYIADIEACHKKQIEIHEFLTS